MKRDGTRDPWAGRLSEYLDGDLKAIERWRMDRHLEGCANCRDTLAGLRQVARRAAGLAAAVAPARDLWPGIAERLVERRRPWWRRALPAGPAGRLLAGSAAACLVMAAAGAALLWMDTAPSGSPPPVTSGPGAAPAVVPGIAGAGEHYDDTVAGLHQFVRTHLTADPHVIDVLEQNLDSLNVAIADYRDALARRPEDARMRVRLEEARQQKLDMLRRVAGLAAGATN